MSLLRPWFAVLTILLSLKAGVADPKVGLVRAMVHADGSVLDDITESSTSDPPLLHQRPVVISEHSKAKPDSKARVNASESLTFCTLVDGREGVLHSAVEIVLPHLIATAHATRAVVLVDCVGPGGRALFPRLAALKEHLDFKYMCVNVSEGALNDWKQMWLEGWWQEEVQRQFDESLTGDARRVENNLRGALHQCLSECSTPFCAFADAGQLIMPWVSSGPAWGLLDCLTYAAREDPSAMPVFATMNWYNPQDAFLPPSVGRELSGSMPKF